MRFKQLLIFILFFLSRPLFSQDTSFIEKIKIPTFIDTLFIDHDRNNWSVRLFTNYKNNKFQLRNTDQKISYTPNNPMGWGVGFGTRKLILDLAFNIKQKGEEPTDRIDFQATLMLNNHYINYTLQFYQGYNVNAEGFEDFRSDIHSFSSAINYIYMFNAAEYSLAAVKSGLSRQKRPAFSTGLGGFLYMNRISADSSIVSQDDFPESNEVIGIVNLQALGGGVRATFSATVPLIKYLFATVSITPGIGLMYKQVETESTTYHPTNPLVYLVDFGGIVGYNGNRIYLNFSMGYALYKTGLDFGNSILYNTANAKLALGYKLGRSRQSR